MKKESVTRLVVSIAIPLLVGFIGSRFTATSVDTWYTSLNKPCFTPPDWVFGAIWTVLFILMGIALYLVWKNGLEKDQVRDAISYFAIQLALNLLWSIVFFGFMSPLLGLVVIVFLWVAIYLTIRKFYSISKVAAWLLVPYLLWVSFATIINLAIILMN